MADAKIAPYGAWESPITAESITASSVSLSSPAVDGDDVYWIEGRPLEGGRLVIVRRAPDGTLTDVIPAPYNARSRVHEYGGGAYLVDRGTVYFTNFADQRLYRVMPGEAAPEPITPELPLRFADAVVDRQRNRLIAVQEDHRPTDREAINSIVAIDLAGARGQGPGARGQGPAASEAENGSGAGSSGTSAPGPWPLAPVPLVSGNDFYSNPRLSPDGTRLAWLTWNHPNMPWDGAELWVGELNAAGTVEQRTLVAGGPSESVGQPEWAPDGTLYFYSDRTGWWNLYRQRPGGAVEPFFPIEADVGEPAWNFGVSVYAVTADGRVICTYLQKGKRHLMEISPSGAEVEELLTPFTEIRSIKISPLGPVFIAGMPGLATQVSQYNFRTGGLRILQRATDNLPPAGYISYPKEIQFPTEGGLTAFGYYYAPRNQEYAAPAGELPPLLVVSHGGPTSAASTSLSLNYQFWTSRGFALLDVNYGGSTGYGRAYRQRLNGQWGVVDVDDCVNGARYLVAQGLADPKRLIIRGGSAGGYTTLAALTTREVFTAGASYYGIADLELLDQDTHKFESRYDHSLIGPYPERRDLYRERSPIYHVDQLNCPVVFFQGLEDKVVPPNQAEVMVAAMRRKKLPVAALFFAGEQHGFRKAETIKRTLEAELSFYGQIFGFTPAGTIEPIKIENLNESIR